MATLGLTYNSLVIATSTTGASVPSGSLVPWSSTSMLRDAVQTPSGTGFSVERAGYYNVTVRFGGGGPQELNMDFCLVLDGADYGSIARPGETLVASLPLGRAQVVSIRNKSDVAIVTNSQPQTSSLVIKAL